MLDDYFQERWPQVSEGACRYMMNNHGLYPVAIGGNKLFLTNSREWVRTYHDGLARLFDNQIHRSTMFGEPVLVIVPLTYRRRITRMKAWRALRNRSMGHILRTLGDSVR